MSLELKDIKALDKLSRADFDGEIIVVKVTDEYVYTSIGAIPVEQLHLYKMKNEITYFATFGGSQLAFTKLNPMSICAVLPGGTEGELRKALQQPPFDNKYCTTYPISEFENFRCQCGMHILTLDEIRNS